MYVDRNTFRAALGSSAAPRPLWTRTGPRSITARMRRHQSEVGQQATKDMR